MPRLADLETVDLDSVEILEADVRIHGHGSPPEGDVYSTDDLRAMALAAQELEAAGEWRVPAKVGGEPLGKTKLGHERDQTLLASGELPAAGWLTNQRVSDDGRKLLADIKHVPKQVAQLVKARAYRTRSAELGSVRSQRTGKSYPWVVTGMAWLGGKIPAVKTLNDIVALYEADDADLTVERRFLLVDEDGASLPEGLSEALIDMARAYVELATGRNEPAADSRPVSTSPYTDEQRRAFAEATGLEQDKVTDEMLAAAGVAEPKTDDADGDSGDGGDQGRELTELRAQLDETTKTADQARKDAEKANEELRLEKRRNFVEELIRTGRVEPGARDTWEKRFDRDPELAREFAEDLKPDPSLTRELGSEGEDERQLSEDEQQARELAEKQEIARRYDIPLEQVI